MNLDPQMLATLLLALRILAVILIGAVVVKQIKNMRNLHTDYPAVRTTVFILTVVLLFGQLIPITLDALVAFGDSYPGRSRQPHILGVSYAVNNASKDVVIGALLFFLHYRQTPPKRDPETGL